MRGCLPLALVVSRGGDGVRAAPPLAELPPAGRRAGTPPRDAASRAASAPERARALPSHPRLLPPKMTSLTWLGLGLRLGLGLGLGWA